MSDDIANARGNRLLVVHVNGALARLKQSLTPDFVLTSQSYATNAFADTTWSTVFRNDLHAARAVVFVGYSLYDVDVSRILFNPDVILPKTHFIDHAHMDPVLATKLARFGRVHPVGIDGFSALISEESRTWTKPELVEQYQCWKRVLPVTINTTPSDEDVYDLILRGVVRDGLLLGQSNTPDDASYTTVRASEAPCFKCLAQPNAVALLIAAFANGKTIAVQSLALQLAASGRDVFTLDRPTDVAKSELQRLCRRDSDFVLVIENYSRNLELVAMFCQFARESCTLLLSEKVEIHEVRAPALLDKICDRQLTIYELDMLENVELTRLSHLLDLRGLWGQRAGLSEQKRLTYLRQQCGRQLHAVLLDVVKSPHIRAKLSDIVAEFDATPDGMRMLIVLCLLQTIGEQPRTDVASELLGLRYGAYRKLHDNPVVRQILNVQSGIALFRSPVIANVVLSGVATASIVTDVVADCIKGGHRNRAVDQYLGQLATELTRFANLERILPANGKMVALQNLYEQIKTVPTIRSNPLFWLQYAMARLSLGDRELARRYFEQSYSIASSVDFDTYQIDNHYCRLLLREAEETTDPDNAYQKVDKTIETLKRQVQRESRHYPYRSAWTLDGVAKRHRKNWNNAQRRTIAAGARYLIDAANRLDNRTARSTAVVGALQRLRAVVELLEMDTLEK